jgi:lipoprotein-releasing system permease protein
MIVLDKKKDISILKAMGATSRQIYNIILYEGLLVSIVGSGAGVLLALFLYFLQRQFGLIGFPDGFVVDAYPIVLRIFDFTVVALTVMGIGLVASILPAKRGAMISAFVREE